MGVLVDTLTNYIKLKDIQIKHTSFENIELESGKLVEEKEHSVILDFTVEQYRIDDIKHSSGALSIELDGEKHECEIIGLDKNHVIIKVHGCSGIHAEGKLLIDMSFILKKQKETLEELKNDEYRILREQLFGEYVIKGGKSIECAYRNERLNDLQKTAISYAVGVNDMFLIWGPPGTGKTTMVPEIIMNYCDYWKRDSGKPKILVCAWTNVAVDNVAKTLHKENNSVLRYGKRTTLNDKTYKEILYDCQEKECIDQIEKEFASKLSLLESAKEETLQKIKECENRITTLENKISELKNESDRIIKDLHNQIDLDVKNFKDFLKSIIETEKSKRQNQVTSYTNELDDAIIKHENIIKFIEEHTKTIRQYETDINNLKTEVNRLEQKIAEYQDILNTAKKYQNLIKHSKYKYLAYRIGIYSPSFLDKLKKYGLHKKDDDVVLSRIKNAIQELSSLDIKYREVLSNKTKKEKLKNKSEKRLDEAEKTRTSLELRQKQLKKEIEKENAELNFLEGNLVLVERMSTDKLPNIEDYSNTSEFSKIKDKYLHLQKCIEDKKTKIEKIKRESVYEIKESEIEITTLKDRILNYNRELECNDDKIKLLEDEKNNKLDNIMALVLSRYDVIATTILETSKIFKIVDFELTIIDEAGAVEVPSALIPMIRSKKTILLGDHKQLQPIIKEKGPIKQFLEEHPELKQSIFELLYNKVRSNKDCIIMLEEQYRMQKNIAEFVSAIFYGNKLKTSNNIETSLKEGLDKILSKEPQMIWFLREYWNKGEKGKSRSCELEVRLMKNIVANFKKAYGEEITDEMAIITPFRDQYKLIKKELPEIDCGTVHRYQGQEKKIIMFSPAESKIFGPLFQGKKGRTLLNVAVSRAQEKFIIIGSSKLKNIPHYGQLYKHIRKTGWIVRDLTDYDPSYSCPICGKTQYNLLYEYCFECEQIKRLQDKKFNEKRTNKCEDGDLVRSIGEILIDNWLYLHGIEHEYEKKLPFTQVLYCDWYLPKYDVYIEFWGSVHLKDRGAHRNYKERLYKDNDLKLISIENDDTRNLNEILSHKLRKFGYKP